MNSNFNQYELFTKQIGTLINAEMKSQGLDQDSLSILTKQSQSTISNIINGKTNVSMKKIFSVMETLGMNPLEEISKCCHTSSDVSCSVLPITSEKLICDPDNPVFNGHLGNYYTYFHPTNANETNCIRGKLHLYSDKNQCNVEFQLLSSNNYDTNNLSTIKHYQGHAFISTIQTAIYIILSNEEIGEMCFLTLPYKPILVKGQNLDCSIALVLTVSSGIESRLPTVHRMLLTRKELDSSTINLLLGQLLLNKSQIRILAEDFDKMCKIETPSEDFIKCFHQHKYERLYYEIREDSFQDISDSVQHYKDLCNLKKYSASPKNNKVKINIASNIYHKIIDNKTRPIQP